MTKIVQLFGEKALQVKEDTGDLEFSGKGFQNELERLMADYYYYSANEARMRQVSKIGDEMTNYLFDVVGIQKKDEHIELRRNALRQHTLERLSDFLLASSKSQWTAHPHRYGAAYLEWFDRMLEVAAVVAEVKKRKASTDPDTSDA